MGTAGALIGDVTVEQRPSRRPRRAPKRIGYRSHRDRANARGKSYVVSDVRIDGGRAPNVFQTTGDHPLGPGGSGDRKHSCHRR